MTCQWQNLLEVKNLTAGYDNKTIIKDISFSLKPSEILGIVGESGCGKSTLLKSISELKGLNTDIESGEILFQGKDLINMKEDEKANLRGSEIAMVFQNPQTSLNPSRKIKTQFYETIMTHKKISKEEADSMVSEIFLKIGLKDTKRILNSYPFELSGGMAQRVAIAMAVILNPKLILADEPTSALDATIQKQVIEELLTLREMLKTAMVVITHNIGVVAKMADRVGVMYGGRMVEYGETKEVLSNPRHPYTKALLKAVPKIGGEIPIGLKGKPPKLHRLKGGCGFYERCECKDLCCKAYDNNPAYLSKNHFVLCNHEGEGRK